MNYEDIITEAVDGAIEKADLEDTPEEFRVDAVVEIAGQHVEPLAVDHGVTLLDVSREEVYRDLDDEAMERDEL